VLKKSSKLRVDNEKEGRKRETGTAKRGHRVGDLNDTKVTKEEVGKTKHRLDEKEP